MSLSLLLDKYDVSTEEGLEKALSEIEKEECEVNEALSKAVSRSCSLEGRLRTASQAFGRLGQMKEDASVASNMVERTAELARDVSAKVRQLDVARSRVALCQRRVHDLIDLQLCSAGVEAAIKANDYETGAGHVARFLSMDPGSVLAASSHGVADPRREMAQAVDTLWKHLANKFREASRKEDAANVERLFKLFPMIGRADEGITLLANHLATQAEASIRRASMVSDSRSDAAVFADAMTRVLEAGGHCVERARVLAVNAPGKLHIALAIIQPVVCAGARRVHTALVSARRLDSKRSGDPLQCEPALAELALTHSRIILYVTFLRRKAEVDAAPLEKEAKQTSINAVENIIANSDLTRTAHDILGQYLELERYFLEESVNKALKLATPQAGVTTSSLVDDVFFIARKVIRRSMSTCSIDGTCAVLNDVASLLERVVAPALRRWLLCPPPEPLCLPPPGGATPLTALANSLNRDSDAQRMLFLAHMVSAEAGAEWSLRLCTEACAEAEGMLRSAQDRAKLHSVAANLGAASEHFRAAHDLALAGIKAALKPRIKAWAEVLAEPDGDLEDVEDDAGALPAALDALSEAARQHNLHRAHDALLAAVVSDIAARAELNILTRRYDREGGLLVERRARRLAAWAGGAAGAARERCARLTQACALLALEKVSHATDALLPAARLSPHDAKEILARRMDFKIDDIKRLKL